MRSKNDRRFINMLLEKLLKVKKVIFVFFSLLVLTSLFQYPILASDYIRLVLKPKQRKEKVIK